MNVLPLLALSLLALPPEVAWEVPAPVDLRAAALLVGGREGGDLPMGAQAWRDSEGARVAVVAEIEAPGVEAGDFLELFLYAIGPGLDVSRTVSKGFRVEGAEAGDSLLLGAELELAEGDELRLLVRWGPRLALRSLPWSEGTGLALSGSRADHVLLPTGLVDRLGGELPRLRATLVPGELFAVRLLPSGEATSIPISIQLRCGETVRELSPEAVEVFRVPDLEGECEMAAGGVGAPLRVSLEPALSIPESLPSPERVEGSLEPAFDSFVPRYLALLEQLARGEDPAASLAALEAEVLERDPERGLDLLTAVEGRVYESLSGPSEWKAVLPAMLMHREVASRHRREGRFALGMHGVRFAAALAGSYAVQVDEIEARREATWILTEMALELRRLGPLLDAEQLLLRARELAPEDVEIELAIATLYEKQDRLEDAQRALDRLLALRPDHPEARLRWAVLERRRGRPQAAQKIFERLVEEGASPDWIERLAWQELTRTSLDRGRLEEAEQTVHRARARWPDDPTFAILQGWLWSRQGQREQARRLLETLSAGSRASDRDRYNRWSDEPFREDGPRLRDRSQERRPELAALLAGAEAE